MLLRIRVALLFQELYSSILKLYKGTSSRKYLKDGCVQITYFFYNNGTVQIIHFAKHVIPKSHSMLQTMELKLYFRY